MEKIYISAMLPKISCVSYTSVKDLLCKAEPGRLIGPGLLYIGLYRIMFIATRVYPDLFVYASRLLEGWFVIGGDLVINGSGL